MRGLTYCDGWFPFCVKKTAQDGEPIEEWDGTTFSGGHPSKSSSEEIDVVGDGTKYPVGFTLEEFALLYWKVRTWGISLSDDGPWSYPSDTITSSGGKYVWDSVNKVYEWTSTAQTATIPAIDVSTDSNREVELCSVSTTYDEYSQATFSASRPAPSPAEPFLTCPGAVTFYPPDDSAGGTSILFQSFKPVETSWTTVDMLDVPFLYSWLGAVYANNELFKFENEIQVDIGSRAELLSSIHFAGSFNIDPRDCYFLNGLFFPSISIYTGLYSRRKTRRDVHSVQDGPAPGTATAGFSSFEGCFVSLFSEKPAPLEDWQADEYEIIFDAARLVIKFPTRDVTVSFYGLGWKKLFEGIMEYGETVTKTIAYPSPPPTVIMEPVTYFTYGGIYSETTGERV